MPQAWPATICADPLIQGLDETFADNIDETQTDSGRPLRSKLYTKAPRRPLSVTLELTREQAATFDTFYHTTLQDGLLAFTFQHPRRLTNVTAYFRKGAPPKLVPDGSGANWLATLTLDIDP